MSYERLARIMGQSTSTTHHWFGLFHHPHVLGFLSLLERLSPAQRHSFISAHCRNYATFDDPRLAHAPGRTGKLIELLKLKAGLTIVTGGTDSSRTFVFTALGHAATRAGGRLLSGAGIDLHLPTRFVPVESLVYIDEALGPNHARQLIQRIWPRVLTSAAPQLFLTAYGPQCRRFAMIFCAAPGSSMSSSPNRGCRTCAILRPRFPRRFMC